MPHGTLVLDGGDLSEVFEQLRTGKDWHRVAQRLSQFNKLGRPLGIRFVLNASQNETQVRYESSEGLARFTRELGAGQGYVQQSFAHLLESKLKRVGRYYGLPASLLTGQMKLLKQTLSRDLGIFGDLDLDEILVPIPAEQNGKRVEALSALAGMLPSSVVITGDNGSGKTTLLYTVIARWEGPAGGARGAAGSPAKKLPGHAPFYLPARHLRFDWTSFEINWSALPGVEPSLAERLQTAFDHGRLVLLIDGVDENPDVLDFANPSVQAFWKAAARNVCVLASLPGFDESHLKPGPFASMFEGGLGRLHLPPWSEADYKKLFHNISGATASRAGAPLKEVVAYLGRLSGTDWHRQASLLRFTPLTGLALANYFASHHGDRLPRNEYELLEHTMDYHLRHEKVKGRSPTFVDTAQGFLMRLAWEAYIQGRSGKYACIRTETVDRVIRGTYPLWDSRKKELFRFLDQLPYLEASPENGLYYMNPHFADYLVARYFIQTFLAGDYKRMREALRVTWKYFYVLRYYMQGLETLEEPSKAHFLEVSQNLFEGYWQEYLKTRDFANEVSISHIIQPMGFLDTEEAQAFLWRVFADSQDKAEFVFMSAAIGLTWGGEKEAIERYVDRLRRSEKAAEWNLNWYLFYKRQDSTRRDIENFHPSLIKRWEVPCDWLLEAMLQDTRDFRPLRLLYAFSLSNFLRRMGTGPFVAGTGNGSSATAAWRRQTLAQKIVREWRADPQVREWPALAKQFKELTALFKKHRIIQGDADHENEERKEGDRLAGAAAAR